MREYGNLVESILSEYESTEETKDLQMIKLKSLELLTVSEYKNICSILTRRLSLFQERFIDSLEENKIENMFLSLLEDNKNPKNIKGLAQCLLRNSACFKVWNLNLKNCVPETILIFNYLCKFN